MKIKTCLTTILCLALVIVIPRKGKNCQDLLPESIKKPRSNIDMPLRKQRNFRETSSVERSWTGLALEWEKNEKKGLTVIAKMRLTTKIGIYCLT